MSNFKPQFSIPRQNVPYWDKKKSDDYSFPTYRELKRNLVAIMKKHNVDEVCVSRSRRGSFGEWFEYWHRYGNVLVKGKEGWM
jgi:hypothetical protein